MMMPIVKVRSTCVINTLIVGTAWKMDLLFWIRFLIMVVLAIYIIYGKLILDN